MKYDPNGRPAGRPNRRSIRLKGYDYTQPGAYFITTCTQDRACLFGDVMDGEMRLNDAGRMVQSVWNEIPMFYPGVMVDEFVVMPNHIHGIIILVGVPPRGCPNDEQPPSAGQAPVMGQSSVLGQARGPAPTGPDGDTVTPLSLAELVSRVKTMTTKRYADGVKRSGWPRFRSRLWQRNYYEHIIRNEESLNRIREYIVNNPLQWELDRENPTVGAGPRACPKNEPWSV